MGNLWSSPTPTNPIEAMPWVGIPPGTYRRWNEIPPGFNISIPENPDPYMNEFFISDGTYGDNLKCLDNFPNPNTSCFKLYGIHYKLPTHMYIIDGLRCTEKRCHVTLPFSTLPIKEHAYTEQEFFNFTGITTKFSRISKVIQFTVTGPSIYTFWYQVVYLNVRGRINRVNQQGLNSPSHPLDKDVPFIYKNDLVIAYGTYIISPL